MNKSILSHDAFFKKSLSIKPIALEYMQMHLPEGVQKFVDLSCLEMQQDSFVATGFLQRKKASQLPEVLTSAF